MKFQIYFWELFLRVFLGIRHASIILHAISYNAHSLTPTLWLFSPFPSASLTLDGLSAKGDEQKGCGDFFAVVTIIETPTQCKFISIASISEIQALNWHDVASAVWSVWREIQSVEQSTKQIFSVHTSSFGRMRADVSLSNWLYFLWTSSSLLLLFFISSRLCWRNEFINYSIAGGCFSRLANLLLRNFQWVEWWHTVVHTRAHC